MPRRTPLSPFAAIYQEAGILPEIRRSIGWMIMANLFGTFWGTIAGGSALTGLAEALGSNDLVFGVLTAIPLFGSLMQIPAALLVSRTKKRKQYLLTIGLFSRALWLLVGLIPFLLPEQPAWLRIWTLILLIGVSSSSGAIINVCFTPWMADLVPITIRGRWLSLRDKVLNLVSVALGLAVARLLDVLPGFTGYAVVFGLCGVFGVLDMFCFLGVKDVPMQTAQGVRIREVFHGMFTDKPFFRFLVFWTVWSFTANFSSPYFMRYALGPQELSFVEVTLAGQITYAVFAVLSLSWWGRQMDRFGNIPVLWITSLITAVNPIVWLLATKGSPLSLFLFNAIGGLVWGAANLAVMNILLHRSPEAHRPSYVAVISAITSILGAFLGVLAGGALLQGIQDTVTARNLLWFGHKPDHYMIVFMLSIVLRLGAIFLFLPRMGHDKQYTTRDMVRTVIGLSGRR